MCFATMVTLFRGFFASNNALVRPETPALRYYFRIYGLGIEEGKCYPITTIFISVMSVFLQALLDEILGH
jgi:hypothetical protein